MTVKTLRHYHQIGLLEPADVDPRTGYRRYTVEQIAVAQVIRRFREVGMPLADIQAVLAAPDLPTRHDRIAAHLRRLEGDLGQTRRAVASLRGLLAPPSGEDANYIEVRRVEATAAVAIDEIVDAEDSVAWLQGALGEMYGILAAQGVSSDGPAGGIYGAELFTHARGQATAFVPCAGPVRPIGRVTTLVVPAAELAIITHSGSPAEVDRAYGALASYVTQHAMGVEGPIREHYLVGHRDTPDETQWRTEIGWPVFQTGKPRVSAANQRG
jgi:DNA-binding transcriptional MerR regulator